jgi:hypothetical protein
LPYNRRGLTGRPTPAKATLASIRRLTVPDDGVVDLRVTEDVRKLQA